MVKDILGKEDGFSSEDRVIILDSLLLLLMICSYDKTKFSKLLNKEDKSSKSFSLQPFLIKGIYSPSPNIRKVFCHIFYLLSRLAQEEEIVGFNELVINALLTNIPKSSNKARVNCLEYFELLCKIIHTVYSSSLQLQKEQTKDFEPLIAELVRSLKNHRSVESRENSQVDNILIGLLKLIEELLLLNPKLRSVFGDPKKYDLI